jgi:spoIIIJ-associated protein
MTESQNEKINTLVRNILNLLGVQDDQIEITSREKTLVVNLNLPEDQSGIFIGHRGETITSLQLLLSLVVSQRLSDWQRVQVNVGDYQQRREEQLFSRVDHAVESAINTGQEIIIPNLNSYERHLVHEYLQTNTSVVTESRGEDPYRQLYVIPKLA